MRIRPASEGLLVPYPGGSRTYLPAGGAEVPDGDRWWLRQLNRGDVVLVEDEPAPKATTTRSRRSSSKTTTDEADEG